MPEERVSVKKSGKSWIISVGRKVIDFKQSNHEAQIRADEVRQQRKNGMSKRN